MKNLIRLLVCVGILASPQLLPAGDCTHAYGDCVTTDAWDVETCWNDDGTYIQTTYWCNGDVSVYDSGNRGHKVKYRTPN